MVNPNILSEKQKIRRNRRMTYTSDTIFDIFNYLFVTIIFIAVLYPVLHVCSASVSRASAIISGKVGILPVGFSLEAYKLVFNYPGIIDGYKNTVFYTLVGTLISVVLTVMAAYPLSRKDLPGRNIIMFLFTFTMLFSGGLIPTFLLVRNLGIYNTIWAILLPPALSTYNVIVTRTFFQTSIPVELLEASQIDGCGNLKFIVSIVLPLSGPIIAVNCLYYAVGQWNNYYNAMIYLQSKELYPLQTYLREILVQNSFDNTILIGSDVHTIAKKQELQTIMKYALIVVSSVPLIIAYPFVQKYFVKGVMIGSLKG